MNLINTAEYMKKANKKSIKNFVYKIKSIIIYILKL